MKENNPTFPKPYFTVDIGYPSNPKLWHLLEIVTQFCGAVEHKVVTGASFCMEVEIHCLNESQREKAMLVVGVWRQSYHHIDRPAFLTGSHVYGEPKETSDIDLVVFIKDSDQYLLHTNQKGGLKTGTLRYGRLNLISCGSPEKYDIWKQGTDMLLARTKVSGRKIGTKEATELFDALFEEADIVNDYTLSKEKENN